MPSQDLVALLFVRETSDPLTSLVKKIEHRVESAAGKTPRPVGAYVIFVNNSDGLDKRLLGLAEKEGLKRVSLCIGEPPRNYEIADEADLTVVIYTVGRRPQQTVTANFAFRKGELDEAQTDAIVKALSEVLPPIVQTVVATAREKEQSWNYTLDAPAEGWFKPDFDDLAWKSGLGGFGTHGTPGAVVRTEWKTGDIWLRRAFTVPDRPFTHLHLQVHHDEDAEIYLNGVLAARLAGYTTDYVEVPLTEEARKALRPGANVLAVHCKQTVGGQYIDVGLVELKR
jgi:hypothetical protein